MSTTEFTVTPAGGGGIEGRGPNPGWRDRAACTGAHADLWFGGRSELARAVVVCHQCPVAEPCLWSALIEEGAAADRHRFGVRGGLLPGARSRLSRVLGHAELVDRYHQALHDAPGRPGAAA